MSEYTREEIMSMTEPQLQIEAAKLLGWEKLFIHGLETVWYVDKTGRNRPGPPPASWETVGAIVEALIEKEVFLDISVGSDKRWNVDINIPTLRDKEYLTFAGESEGDTAFIAVTRAALMAVNNL